MLNEVNNFGYVHSGDIRDFLAVSPDLYGCGITEKDELRLDILKDLECNFKFKSYSFKEALKYTDNRLIGVVYCQLLAINCMDQIEDELVGGHVVFCDFTNYECNYISKYDMIDYLVGILRYRGFKTIWDKGTGMLSIHKTDYGNDVKEIYTISMECTLDNIEELVFRGCAETLTQLDLYRDIEKHWKVCKTALAQSDISDVELRNHSYFMLKFFSFITRIHDTLQEELTEDDCMRFLDAGEVPGDLLNYLLKINNEIDTELGLKAVDRNKLLEMMETMEETLDHFFTTDMKLCACPEFTDSDIEEAVNFYLKASDMIPTEQTATSSNSSRFIINKNLAVACAVLIALVALVRFVTL